MRFLSPLALVGLAMIALPIAIHLLVRRRAAKLDFPSLKFLRETPSFRLRPRRIQQPLLLGLRLAAFVLLVIGLSSPLFLSATKSPRTRIILIDASLSMRARGVAEAAREQARALVNNLGTDERAAVVSFASNAVVRSETTSDKRTLTDAIGRYQPTNETGDFVAAMTAAGKLLSSEMSGETLISIVSDFQASGLPRDDRIQLLDQSNGTTQVITHPVGIELERNAFLLDEDITSGDSGAEISATDLIAIGDERSANRKAWTLNSSAGARADIEWRTEPNGQISARVQSLTPDDFDLDDSRFIAFTLPRMRRALLIERDGDETGLYFRAAFEAAQSDMGEKSFVFESKATLPVSPTDLNAYSLVTLTLHGEPHHDEMRLLADYVRRGGSVWLCLAGDVDTSAWNQFAGTEEGRFLPFTRVERSGDKIHGKSFGTVDGGAPVLRSMSEQLVEALRAVRVMQGFTITPRVESSTLIRWNDNESAFVGGDVEQGNILLLATSPGRTAGDLGASMAFPALTSSIVKASNALDAHTLEIGQPVILGLAPSETVRVIKANGELVSATARDLVIAPAHYFPEPGVYRVESNTFVKYLAINTPRSESEFAFAPATEIQRVFRSRSAATDQRKGVSFESAERPGRVWRYFLLAAFLLLIAEMFISIRQREKEGLKTEG